MVPVVDTVAVGEQLARANNVVELRDAVLRVVAAAAVHVAIEDAGVAIRTEEDEGVRERLEPRGHPVLERLADLRVVLLSAVPYDLNNTYVVHESAGRQLESLTSRTRSTLTQHQ